MPQMVVGNIALPYILPFILIEGGYKPTTGTETAIYIQSCRNVVISDVIIEELMSTPGITIDSSNVHIKDSMISNKGVAIYATNRSKVTSKNNTGSSNTVVFKAGDGGFIYIKGLQPYGLSDKETSNGGYIFERGEDA